MTTGFFTRTEPIRYEGPNTGEPLAFRWYDPERIVAGRTMREHLRFAVCYWHSFTWPGGDPFGGATFDRPWFSDSLDAARAKADVAFEMFRLLDAPFFTFHDRDIAPEGATLADSNRNVREIADLLGRKMEESGIRLLWGTANLFSNRRFMAGASTNPDPELFAYAAAQVKNAMDVTHELGGQNYVLWGGREGYETLLNTDLAREIEQYGRFLTLVAEHKAKIGFEGQLLIEPKPQEPTKHQYDYDVSTIYGTLKRFGLENEYRVNIEQNHAILAGHSFEHEIAMAAALGIFGSIDINRGDYQSGWDTDQFAMNVPELTLAMYEILKAGGFEQGGLNFDAKIRRQSIDPDDLLHAHVTSMDAIARALLAAAELLEDGTLSRAVEERYAGWNGDIGRDILGGRMSLDDLARHVGDKALDPQPRSGRQEYLEGVVNRFF
ncbi:xylose isomerase [Lutibaculum baratangense]|uniref:Xylose isomerase n=1 Tax=Lutibaculum baratangense AMV1 TaxID=631454 RepID=V4RPS8_9HYPH|nr:xylose isomerase [Lutibaculum baratangense]ESR27284.1 Xylose isomerase [Lutibaculum baratangense AMV1]